MLEPLFPEPVNIGVVNVKVENEVGECFLRLSIRVKWSNFRVNRDGVD